MLYNSSPTSGVMKEVFNTYISCFISTVGLLQDKSTCTALLLQREQCHTLTRQANHTVPCSREECK